MKLKIRKIHPDAIIPKYATAGAAAFDLHALIPSGRPVTIGYGEPVSIRTGLALEVPEGYGLVVLSRSGHGFNWSTRLANAVGLIDSDYRGEIMVKLARDLCLNGTEPLQVRHGDRIAQAAIVPMPRVEFEEVDHLDDTDRGAAGFGSTGMAAQMTASIIAKVRGLTPQFS